MSLPLREALTAQYRQHPSWSYQLHADNLAVLAEQKPAARAHALLCLGAALHESPGPVQASAPRAGPQPGRPSRPSTASRAARVRSYESQYVNGLWHLDFHHGSLARVLLENGQWAYPLLLGVLDDHSPALLPCPVVSEPKAPRNSATAWARPSRNAALPRALMSDNGSAMLAGRDRAGPGAPGHRARNHPALSARTRTESKRVFWDQIEGRLLPMLEGVADLTLRQLNEATLAFVEMEYNRKTHSELGRSPSATLPPRTRTWAGPVRPAEQLQLAFTAEVGRTQRRSDGTLSLEGVRFEVPSRYGHFQRVSSARGLLGPEPRLSVRPQHRRHPLPALSPGQTQKRRGPARRQSLAAGGAGHRPGPGPRRWRRCCRNSSKTTPPPACPRPICPKMKSTTDRQPLMNKKLLSLYSLKFNPFSPEIPTAALWVAPPLENFCWRIEQQVGEGGFALAMGDPGTGKSAALRLLGRTPGPVARRHRRHAHPAPGRPGRLLPRTGRTLRRAPLARTTAGPAPKSCGKNGTTTSKPPSTARSCSSMKPRK